MTHLRSKPEARGALAAALVLVLAPPVLARAPGDGDGEGNGDGTPAPAAAATPDAGTAPAFVFDARAAEHLLSRAGFGATGAEVRRAVDRGLEATVDELLAGDPTPREPYVERIVGDRKRNQALRKMAPDARRAENRRMRGQDRRQLDMWIDWWMGRLLHGDDPLRERMVLFWHGLIPSAMSDVRNGYEMIQQDRLVRREALGTFGELLHAIARDPAMLEYLDNDENRKGNPNENFARELMELFTLGEGNYTESDVHEAARAFTGLTDRDGVGREFPRLHDDGSKTVLGVTGDLDGDDVIDVLLAKPECAMHLADKLITYLEGVPPTPERREHYAQLLFANGYQLTPFLRELLTDPAFYRAEVVGGRIASPIDFLVGSARRLGVDPPGSWVYLAAGALGERLFEPPSVAGWPGGEAWISTSSLMERGNLAGVLAGALSARELADLFREPPPIAGDPDGTGDSEPAADDGSSAGDATMEMDGGGSPDQEMSADAPKPAGRRAPLAALSPLVRQLTRLSWDAHPNLTAICVEDGARRDGAIVRVLCDELLAVPVTPESRAQLLRFLRTQRVQLGVRDGQLLVDPRRSEPLLRRLAHLILGLPEAQLD